MLDIAMKNSKHATSLFFMLRLRLCLTHHIKCTHSFQFEFGLITLFTHSSQLSPIIFPYNRSTSSWMLINTQVTLLYTRCWEKSFQFNVTLCAGCADHPMNKNSSWSKQLFASSTAKIKHHYVGICSNSFWHYPHFTSFDCVHTFYGPSAALFRELCPHYGLTLS